MSMNLIITVAMRKTAEGTRPPEFSRLEIPISVFYTDGNDSKLTTHSHINLIRPSGFFTYHQV
jgi:hypothetical protein